MGKKYIISMQEINCNKTVDKAFHEFIQQCKIKNLSPSTIHFYEGHFKRFDQFICTQGIAMLQDITKSIVNDYIVQMKEDLDNPISINTYLRCLRAFLYFCMKLQYIKEFKIELIKTEKKIKETYTDAELKLLLKKPNLKDCSFAEYRDWVMVNFLLGTGVRLSTLMNIKIQDIDCNNGYFITRHTKNKKQQLIPLPSTLINIMIEYLDYRKGDEADFLFCTVDAQQLKKSSVVNTIKYYNRNRGVSKTSIHLFRHTFSKKWILAGGDIFRLQKLLGHSSIEMVREYVEMFNEDLQKDFDKFNPLEQLTQCKSHISMSKQLGK
jgi:integrase/recombinase XerD